MVVFGNELRLVLVWEEMERFSGWVLPNVLHPHPRYPQPIPGLPVPSPFDAVGGKSVGPGMLRMFHIRAGVMRGRPAVAVSARGSLEVAAV